MSMKNKPLCEKQQRAKSSSRALVGHSVMLRNTLCYAQKIKNLFLIPIGQEDCLPGISEEPLK